MCGGSFDITPLRSVGNLVRNGVVDLLFGSRYTDLCYGYNGFWRHRLDHLHVDCDGFEVETLINVRAAAPASRSSRRRPSSVHAVTARAIGGRSETVAGSWA
jgi:hypothetical protein